MITFYLIISLITLISLILFSIYANKIKFLDNPLNEVPIQYLPQNQLEL